MLKKTLSGKTVPHAFLFTGPSGTGKTTLARILAPAVGVSPESIIEIDGATHSKVENMRSITDQVQYRALRGADGKRFVLLDEAHAVSSAAWQSLLKSIEEPPAHVYWAFCTTNISKVPDTIRTRCQVYNLRKLQPDELFPLLERVNTAEKFHTSDEILDVICRNADGSPRRALSYLQKVAGETDKAKVLEALSSDGKSREAIDLARMVCNRKGLSWADVVRTIGLLSEKETPENVRLVIVNYAQSVLLKETKDPSWLLQVLDIFCGSGPYHNESEHWAPLLLAFGRLLFEE
jgi:DNA polymerase III gamma/tau subunit